MGEKNKRKKERTKNEERDKTRTMDEREENTIEEKMG